MSQRNLKLILGSDTLSHIRQANILIVGVGGIGCQLLKNLAKSGFRRFTILDLDIIETTNLNRQFMFRKEDVSHSKAQVGARRIKEINPDLEIIAINADIKEARFNIDFFTQFNLAISALDNVKVRRHLNEMCNRANIPLVDAGTEGFNGQTRSIIKGITECHACRPINNSNNENFAVCTIRLRPEKPIHCIVYAKNFYDCFFGPDKQNAFKGEIGYDQFVCGQLSEEQLKSAAVSVFDALFHEKVQKKQDMQESKGVSVTVHPLKFTDAVLMTEPLQNPPSTYNLADSKKQATSPYLQDKIWSIRDYALKFVECLVNIFTKKTDMLGQLSFQKDDEDCMMLVYCVTTLRTYNFMNRISPKNQHKFMSFFECKDKAGRTIPAIASTNSIAAATQIQQVIKLLDNNRKQLHYITFNNRSTERVIRNELATPNLNCDSCSKRTSSILLQADFQRCTYGQLFEYLEDYLGNGRDLEAFYVIGEKKGEKVTIQRNVFWDDNLNSVTNIIYNSSMSFTMDCSESCDFGLSIFVQNVNGTDVRLKKPLDGKQIKRDYLEFKRAVYEEKLQDIGLDLQRMVMKKKKSKN